MEVFFILRTNIKTASSHIKHLAVLAILAAASVVLGKFLQIPIGDTIRISLENLPVIFAGIVFGPLSGAAVATVADLVGCVAVGYTVNPLITLGAAVVGFSAGVTYMPWKQSSVRYPCVLISTASAHILGSMIAKTVGLRVAFDTPWSYLIFTRMPVYLVNIVVESVLIYFILKSKAVDKALKPFVN